MHNLIKKRNRYLYIEINYIFQLEIFKAKLSLYSPFLCQEHGEARPYRTCTYAHEQPLAVKHERVPYHDSRGNTSRTSMNRNIQ